MSDVTQFLTQRYLTSSELLSTFNPERLHAHGEDSTGIGSDPAASGPFYVFVTRPDLNVLDAAASKMLGVGSPMAPNVLAEHLSGGTGFIKLLTNLAQGFQSQDVVLDVYQVAEGWDGAKVTVPKSTLNSRQDGTIQLEFDEHVGTPVTLLHKIWVDYIEAVTRGALFPKTAPDYVKNRVLDYAVAIYCFQTLPDGQTIQFAMKLTGAFPTAVPFSAFKGQVGATEAIRVTVPYAYSYMEAMDNAIFSEFNKAAGGTGVSVIGVGDEKRKGGTPLKGGRLVYRLQFDGAKSAAVPSSQSPAVTPAPAPSR